MNFFFLSIFNIIKYNIYSLGKVFAGPPRTTPISYGWLHRWRDVSKYPMSVSLGKNMLVELGEEGGALAIPEGAAIWRLLFKKK